MVEDAIVGFTFCWIFWVIFTSISRYLTSRTKAALQEKILQRIDSAESLIALASSESGQRFLSAITLEETQVTRPYNRILFGVQAGIVLIFFGASMLFLHHHISDPDAGFMIIGTGVIGLGLGFFVAAAASIVLSQQLGLVRREPRG